MAQQEITTAEELEAALEMLRQRGGDDAAYERDLVALGARLGKPIGSRRLLDLARLGWEAYSDHVLEPSPGPVHFLGRPQGELTPASPRIEPRSGQPAEPEDDRVADPAYLRLLEDHLQAWLESQDDQLSEDEVAMSRLYVPLLARPELRRELGRQHSLDLHALCVLVMERIGWVGGVAEVPADLERALFRWLHLTAYADVPDDVLAEQAARREVRLAHAHRPAVEVAAMTCERGVPAELPLGQLADGFAQTGMTRAQLEGLYESRAGRSTRWAGRAEGFAETGRLDLPSLAAGADPEALDQLKGRAVGHLLRWMLDHDVVVNALRLPLAEAYAPRVVRRLAREQTVAGPSVNAHLTALFHIRKEDPVGLADELMLLAWLAEQAAFGIRLDSFLADRARVLSGEGVRRVGP